MVLKIFIEITNIVLFCSLEIKILYEVHENYLSFTRNCTSNMNQWKKPSTKNTKPQVANIKDKVANNLRIKEGLSRASPVLLLNIDVQAKKIIWRNISLCARNGSKNKFAYLTNNKIF